MSILLAIKNTSADKTVIAERLAVIEDGRQMLPNGVQYIEPGETEDVLLSAKQLIRLTEMPSGLAETQNEPAANTAE